jgi:saccharopine dehydrogenase-like NADP-dependent oxidoreductase
MQDVVLVFVTVSGTKAGRLMQQTYAHKIYARNVGGVMRSAIQITTAAGICATLDLLAEGELASQGFIRQEEIGLGRFLDNRFGAVYADDGRALDPVWSLAPTPAPASAKIKVIA